MGLNRAGMAAALFSTAIVTVSFAELIGVGDELSSPVIVYDSQGGQRHTGRVGNP